MFPNSFDKVSYVHTSNRSHLFLVTEENANYIIKISKETTAASLEAYKDEYETFSKISHPSIPMYFGYEPHFCVEGMPCGPALCIEYLTGTAMSSISHFNICDFKKYILDIGNLLSYLLNFGVLYTDLHENNILIEEGHIKLLDFTYAYYFLRNPSSLYTPNICYGLDLSLGGQQILIQSLSLLIKRLIDDKKIDMTSSLCAILQTGLHPHSSLLFYDFLDMIENIC